MKKLTTDEFVARAISTHGLKYDYSKATYVNAKTPLTVICNAHGEFNTIPNNHVSGKSGCPKCGIETQGLNSRLTQNEFLEKAILVHGLKYDYNKAVYSRHCDKIIVICKNRGEFSLTANNHLEGVGCKKCYHGKLSIDKSFDIETLKKLKSDDNTAILSLSGKHMIIDCKIHGKAKISKYRYGNKIICPKCSIRSRHDNQKIDFDEFCNRYTKKYPDIEILFDRDSFRNMNEPMKVSYNGVESELTPNQLLHGGILYYPGYATLKSNIELKLAEKYPEFKSGDRSAIKPYELDLYSEKYSLAIEVNGVYWHSDKFKDRNYHLIKTLKCEKRGISLLHFWETELENNFDWCCSIIDCYIKGDYTRLDELVPDKSRMKISTLTSLPYTKYTRPERIAIENYVLYDCGRWI